MKNLFNRLTHHYTYNLKLKTKLIISHAILILLPAAVLSGFLFVKFYEIVIDDTIRSEQALSAQSAASIENILSHVSYISDALMESTTMNQMFYIPQEEAARLTTEKSQIDSLLHLTENLTDHTLITGIRIYYDDTVYQNLCHYNTKESCLFTPVSDIISSYWYEISTAMDETQLLCPKLYLTLDEVATEGTMALISKIPYPANSGSASDASNTSAYLAVYFSEDVLHSVLANNASVENEVAFLVNEHSIMVESSDLSLAEAYSMPSASFSTTIGSPREFSLVSYDKGPAYTAYFPIDNTDWYMISLIPASHITDAGTKLMIQFSLAYLLFAVIALIIALRLSNSIADRLIAVAYQMEKVKTGRPHPMEVEETGCDEIGVLTDTYNYMTREINGLMDSQAQASSDLRKAEFRALQAQINPHFLYNTLDMINWLSKTGKTDEVSSAIQALSRFYKLTLSKKGLMNTIEEELEHVTLYVRLQNMRYDHCAGFVIDVPEELLEYTIPKLTFQPIVENALLHGIMAKEDKKGSLLLTGWPEGEDIIFVISDDGIGIPPEKLSSILTEETGSPHFHGSADSNHIGVYNTNLRLKSLYGPSYGLSFQSRYGEGTDVIIRIPARHYVE